MNEENAKRAKEAESYLRKNNFPISSSKDMFSVLTESTFNKIRKGISMKLKHCDDKSFLKDE